MEPHRPPFDNTTRISGYNLFVSAYHGFATLGNEHVPSPRAFDSFPPFAVVLVGATNVGGELRIQLQVPIAPVFHPERYRLLAKIQLTESGKGRNPGLMRNHLALPFDAASNATVRYPRYRLSIAVPGTRPFRPARYRDRLPVPVPAAVVSFEVIELPRSLPVLLLEQDFPVATSIGANMNNDSHLLQHVQVVLDSILGSPGDLG